MIVVDTSALMAVVLKEPEAEACKAALAAEDEILISAGTLAELSQFGGGLWRKWRIFCSSSI